MTEATTLGMLPASKIGLTELSVAWRCWNAPKWYRLETAPTGLMARERLRFRVALLFARSLKQAAEKRVEARKQQCQRDAGRKDELAPSERFARRNTPMTNKRH